jgi:regulator of cell morphogenesis and NO signaling
MTINENTTVAEIAAALPSSVRVFQRHNIDFCCGGKVPLANVCLDRGLPFETVVNDIAVAASATPATASDWLAAPLPTLITHIVRTYHDPLREELPRLGMMANKVASVHGQKDARLRRIAEIVADLSSDLLMHMEKEERVLFPAIELIDRQETAPMELGAPISVMEHEHDHVGTQLDELRSLTAEYVPPQWGCATLRALYAGLSELADTMHVHVHLENNVLFPRALRRLESA